MVALGAAAAAAGLAAFYAIAVADLSARANLTFWAEIGMDTPIAWLCFLLVLGAPLFLRFAQLSSRFRMASLPLNRGGATSWHVKIGALAIVSALLCGLLMQTALHGLAYTPDEQSAVMQARTLAAGHLTPHVNPALVELVVPHWLQDDFIALSRHTGFYGPTYWPGYALLMAPFALAHIEWMYNPVLTGLSLIGIFLLARRLTRSEEAAWWAVALTACSSQIALQGATYFSMPAHLAFNILFCLLFARNTRKSAFAAGLVGGFALVLHNPVPHFSFALPWIVWMAFARRSHLPALLAGYALVFLPLGLGWSAHLQIFDPPIYASGSAQATGVSASSPGAQVLSRIASVVRPPDEILLLARGAGLCKFAVWAAPGAVGLAMLGWLQARRERRSAVASEPKPNDEHRFDASYLWLLGVSLVFNFLLYFGVRFDQGHGWGFRYLHQSWLAIPILGGFYLSRASYRWKQMAAIWCALGLLLVIPIRALQMRALWDVLEQVRPPAPPATPSITFVRERREIAAVWIQNDPFLRNPHWMLRSGSPAQNATLARRFLQNAHQVQRGEWGETWTGPRFSRPGSP